MSPVNQFNPYGYNQYMPQIEYPNFNMQQPVRISNVNGRAGAEAFKLGPDSSIFLLDSKDPVIWMVTTDSAATKTITRIKAIIEPEEQSSEQSAQSQPKVDDGMIEKLDNIVKRLTKLEERFDAWEK